MTVYRSFYESSFIEFYVSKNKLCIVESSFVSRGTVQFILKMFVFKKVYQCGGVMCIMIDGIIICIENGGKWKSKLKKKRKTTFLSLSLLFF